jgi:hypothetical protein
VSGCAPQKVISGCRAPPQISRVATGRQAACDDGDSYHYSGRSGHRFPPHLGGGKAWFAKQHLIKVNLPQGANVRFLAMISEQSTPGFGPGTAPWASRERCRLRSPASGGSLAVCSALHRLVEIYAAVWAELDLATAQSQRHWYRDSLAKRSATSGTADELDRKYCANENDNTDDGEGRQLATVETQWPENCQNQPGTKSDGHGPTYSALDVVTNCHGLAVYPRLPIKTGMRCTPERVDEAAHLLDQPSADAIGVRHRGHRGWAGIAGDGPEFDPLEAVATGSFVPVHWPSSLASRSTL